MPPACATRGDARADPGLARPGEGPALSDLAMRAKAHWGYDAAFLEACRPHLAIDEAAIIQGRTLVVRRQDHCPLGVGVVELDGDEAEITRLFVDPPVIGQGVGARLITALEALVVRHGHKSVCLAADPFASPFYERMGYRHAGRVASEAIQGRSLPLYRKTLTGPDPHA